MSTMDGGGVPGGGTPESLASELLVVLVVPVGDVVSDVVFPDIYNLQMPELVGLMAKLGVTVVYNDAGNRVLSDSRLCGL